MIVNISKKQSALIKKLFNPLAAEYKRAFDVASWVALTCDEAFVRIEWSDNDNRWCIHRRTEVDDKPSDKRMFVPFDAVMSGDAVLTLKADEVIVETPIGPRKVMREEWEQSIIFQQGLTLDKESEIHSSKVKCYPMVFDMAKLKVMQSHLSIDTTRGPLMSFIVNHRGVTATDGRRLIQHRLETGLPERMRFNLPRENHILSTVPKNPGMMNVWYEAETDEAKKKRVVHNSSADNQCEDAPINWIKTEFRVPTDRAGNYALVTHEKVYYQVSTPDVEQVIPKGPTTYPVLKLEDSDIDKLRMIDKTVDQVSFLNGRVVNEARSVNFELAGKLSVSKISLNPRFVVDVANAGLPCDFMSDSPNDEGVNPVAVVDGDMIEALMPLRVI